MMQPNKETGPLRFQHMGRLLDPPRRGVKEWVRDTARSLWDATPTGRAIPFIQGLLDAARSPTPVAAPTGAASEVGAPKAEAGGGEVTEIRKEVSPEGVVTEMKKKYPQAFGRVAAGGQAVSPEAQATARMLSLTPGQEGYPYMYPRTTQPGIMVEEHPGEVPTGVPTPDVGMGMMDKVIGTIHNWMQEPQNRLMLSALATAGGPGSWQAAIGNLFGGAAQGEIYSDMLARMFGGEYQGPTGLGVTPEALNTALALGMKSEEMALRKVATLAEADRDVAIADYYRLRPQEQDRIVYKSIGDNIVAINETTGTERIIGPATVTEADVSLVGDISREKDIDVPLASQYFIRAERMLEKLRADKDLTPKQSAIIEGIGLKDFLDPTGIEIDFEAVYRVLMSLGPDGERLAKRMRAERANLISKAKLGVEPSAAMREGAEAIGAPISQDMWKEELVPEDLRRDIK